MNYLLIASTAKEIGPFLEKYRRLATPPPVDVLVTGLGIASTVYALTKQLSIKRPGLVIQAGVGGSFDPNLALGSVVMVKRDRIADLGVMENGNWKTIFDLGLVKPNRFPFRQGWLTRPGNEIPGPMALRQVTGITVNELTTSKKTIHEFKEKFKPAIESMEGAALHYVCLLEDVPFLQLRSVSNYVGERNKQKWDLKTAIANLNVILSGLLLS